MVMNELESSTEKRSKVKNAGGILQGNLLLKTCFQRSSCGPAKGGRVLYPRLEGTFSKSTIESFGGFLIENTRKLFINIVINSVSAA